MQTKREMRSQEVGRLKRFDGQTVTADLIEQARTKAGGWITEFFVAIGEGRQPSHGWRERAIGKTFSFKSKTSLNGYPKVKSPMEMLTEEFREEIDSLKARVTQLENESNNKSFSELRKSGGE